MSFLSTLILRGDTTFFLFFYEEHYSACKNGCMSSVTLIIRWNWCYFIFNTHQDNMFVLPIVWLGVVTSQSMPQNQKYLCFSYSIHSSPLLKPGAYIIHNATQPLTVQPVTQVCNANQAASLQQRQGAGYRGLVSLLVCNFLPPDFFCTLYTWQPSMRTTPHLYESLNKGKELWLWRSFVMSEKITPHDVIRFILLWAQRLQKTALQTGVV